VPLVADGVLYGPFPEPPAETDAPPASAPVAGGESMTIPGPGEYATNGSVAREPGYYTWVWTIDAARQDAVGKASLPVGYNFATRFGVPEETHSVHASLPRLAATGSAPRDAGAVGAALLACGVMLALGSRGRGGAGLPGVLPIGSAGRRGAARSRPRDARRAR
jgi:hypothetical protein